MRVLDASAALAFLLGEPGADVVKEHVSDAVIGAANLCEVLCRFNSVAEAGFAASLLETWGVRTEPVTRADATLAASLKRRLPHLSLGDRLCLALSERLDAEVFTADRAWGDEGRVRQIR